MSWPLVEIDHYGERPLILVSFWIIARYFGSIAAQLQEQPQYASLRGRFHQKRPLLYLHLGAASHYPPKLARLVPGDNPSTFEKLKRGDRGVLVVCEVV